MSPKRQKSRSDGSKIIAVTMMEIYIDVLWAVNTYMTWLLLSLTAALTRTPSRPMNRAAASVVGGLCSLMILLPTHGKVIAFTLAVLKVLSCILITAVGFWRISLKKLMLLSAAFLGSNMLICAAMILIQNAIGARPVAVSGGFIYMSISPTALIVSTAVIYLLVCRISKLFDSKFGERNSYRVEFRIGCKAYSLDGLADTGNRARDLFSGLPVIICTGVDIPAEGYLRAVPYRTVAGEGILYAAMPDELTVTDGSGRKYAAKALVAGLPKGGERRAVFSPEILGNTERG